MSSRGPVDDLPFSRPADVAANRDARLSSRQQLDLWYSGLWRLLAGLFTAGAGVAIAGDPEFMAMAVGLGFVGAGLYLSWRGFSFLGDAITRNVTYVTGRLDTDTVVYKSTTSYYMIVGPVRQRTSRKICRALPSGLNCHAYFASGSLHLLSLEPASAEVPHPSLRFGGDAAHAWDRLRWRLIVAAVAVFGIAAGFHAVAIAHPANTTMVSGSINGYDETFGRRAYRHLYLADSSQEFSLDRLSSYSPSVPYLGLYFGDRVDLYVKAGTGGDVLALRLRETLYAEDYYLHPEHQQDDMVRSGATVAVLSGLALLLVVSWQRLFRMKRAVAPG